MFILFWWVEASRLTEVADVISMTHLSRFGSNELHIDLERMQTF